MHLVEEGVDRAAQARQRRHGGGEILGLQRRIHRRAGGPDGEGQGDLFLGLAGQAGLDHAGRHGALLLLGLAGCWTPACSPPADWSRRRCAGTPSSASTRRTMRTRSSSPSAKTASTRSWRLPWSRRRTFRRSAKKARSRVRSRSIPLDASAEVRTQRGHPLASRAPSTAKFDSAISSPSSTRNARASLISSSIAPFSSTSRITPSAARLRANGSFDPVGFSSMAKKPTRVSSLSARATATRQRRGRHGVGRALRLVVVADGVGDGVGMAEGAGIIAAHHALQFRELADHAAGQIGLGQTGGALRPDRGRPRPAARSRGPGRRCARPARPACPVWRGR